MRTRGTKLAAIANALSLAPALDLDLRAASVDSRVTFARASSTWDFNSAGVLTAYGNNVWPVAYDPVTLAVRGRGVWEQRTGLVLNSANPSLSPWANGAGATGNALPPDGLFTPWRVISGGNAADRRSTPLVTCPAAAVVTIVVRPGTSGRILTGVADVTAATETTISGVIGAETVTLTNAGSASIYDRWTDANGLYWLRYIFTPTTPANTFSFRVGPSTANVGQYIDLYGLDIQAGAYPTPFIVTGASQVTRLADVPTIASGQFSTLYSPAQGSLFARALGSGRTSGAARLLQMDKNVDENDRISLIVDGATRAARATVVNGGVTQADISVGTMAISADQAIAMSYKANDFNAAKAGVSGTPDVSGSVPTPVQMGIGVSVPSGLWWNGYISAVKYYRRAMSAAQLSSLTA